MRILRQQPQAGFTIIELLFATIIFAAALVVILASFLQIGRIYYKGVSVASTNEATRTVVDDITSDVRLGLTNQIALPQPETPGSPYQYFCVGAHRYSYKINLTGDPTLHQVTPSDINSPNVANPNGIILGNVSGGCPSPLNQIGTNNQQLLGVNMQLNRLDFNCTTLNGIDSCSLIIRVVFFGSVPSVLTPTATDPSATCQGNLLSTEFCSVAVFSTNAITNF